jgi:hypothetical protein
MEEGIEVFGRGGGGMKEVRLSKMEGAVCNKSSGY